MDEKIQENEKVKKEKSNAFIEVVNEVIDALPIPDVAKKIGKSVVSGGAKLVGKQSAWRSRSQPGYYSGLR